MNKKIKTLSIFAAMFFVAFGGGFISQYKKPVTQQVEKKAIQYQPTPAAPLTDKQKLLNSLLEIKRFEVSGDISMFTTDNNRVTLSLDGIGDISDFDDIQIEGDIVVGLNGSKLNAGFGYFDGEIFFDFNESYFRLETDSLLDFVGLLPTEYGMEINIPSEFENMDLGQIESFIDGISEKELTPDGQNYFFTFDLSDKITLKILTDLDLNFTGISTDTIDYDGMLFNADIKLERKDELVLHNPKDDLAVYTKYQDFSPAYKLFDAIYSLTKEKQNTINADISVYQRKDELNRRALLSTNVDITYDLLSENHCYALEGQIKTDFDDDELMRSQDYSFALVNKAIYANYGSVAISAQTDSLTSLLGYVLSKIGDEKINTMLESFISTIDVDEMIGIAEKASDLLGTIVLTNDQLGINLNTSIFNSNNVNLNDMYVAINFNADAKKLTTIEIRDVKVNDYEGDLVLTFGEYKPFLLENRQYQEIDSFIPVAGLYDVYKDQTQYRIEFDATLGQEGKQDVLVDGGLQFELDPLRYEEGHSNVGYGYGLVTIQDRKDVEHNIYVDMKSVDEVLLAYSTVTGNSSRDNVDPLYAKMKVKTLTDIYEMFEDIIQNPDDHFYEILSGILGDIKKMPIYDLLFNKNYLALTTTNLIDRFEVGNGYLEMDIALDIISMEGASFTLRIEYDAMSENQRLIALKVSNFNFKGLTVAFNAYLKEFNPALESGRLSPANRYIDFSDLRVLLELGINTSKNNYYHLKTTKCDVKFTFINLPLNLDIDIKVWTKNGDVSVSADIAGIPAIALINQSISYADISDRVGHIYYHDGYFYVERTEVAKAHGFIVHDYYDIDYVAKYNTDDFLDNIVDILCEDILCLSSTIMSMINNSIERTNDEGYQMKYESILNDFVYSPDSHYFYLDVNLNEIANSKAFESFTVKVLTDETNTHLKGINPYISIGFGSLGITADLEIVLADCSLVADDSNRLTSLDRIEGLTENQASGYEHEYKTKRN